MEKFEIKINNTSLEALYTMAEAIDMCRERAMRGNTVSLYARRPRRVAWVFLGTYTKDAPYRIINSYTGKASLYPRCSVAPAELRTFHF